VTGAAGEAGILGAVGRVTAIVFDFNGTLSNDEPILCGIFRALFDELGCPLSDKEYYELLAGLSDEAIVSTWLGEDYAEIGAVVAERIRRYRSQVADGATISESTREAVRYAASRTRLAIVSGAALEEIVPVLEAAGIRELFEAVISSDLVVHGKPNPEGYLTALALLGVSAPEVVAFEDTEAGVASAVGAGLRCIAVRGTVGPRRLAAASELIETIDLGVVRRLFEGR
jgi:beta-phosphoglucomutase